MKKCLIIIKIFIVCLVFSQQINARNLWDALRSSFRIGDQSRQPKVKAQIQWLMKHPRYFEQFAINSRPYIYYILEEIKRNNMPGEIALLPMIESSYNPFAYSHAGAAGLWQLMPGTGSGLGIKQNWWFDGRRSIISSTHAALNYLTYLNRFFKGDWLHVFAAYDSGEGTVQRAIWRNKKKQAAIDFWSLRLPRETQAYLPRLLALCSIIRAPYHYNIRLPKMYYGPYFQQVSIGSQIDLTHAARLANVEYKELLKLNPGHNRWATSPTQPYTLLLPTDKIHGFKAKLKTIPKNKRVFWSRYIVKNGDSLGLIAQKHKSAVKVIKDANHLSTNLIKKGQILFIPASKTLSKNMIQTRSKNMRIGFHRIPKRGPNKIVHIVKRYDSFAKLSRRYHEKPSAIRFWNQMSYQDKLHPGQKIIIWKKQRRVKYKVYVVKNGDTLGAIALKYHVKLKDIKKWNPRVNIANLKIKQKIILYA